MTHSPSSQRLLFGYSLEYVIIYDAVIVGVILVDWELMGPATGWFFVIPGLVGTYCSIGLLWRLTKRVRSAKFYEDGFRIIGWGLDERISYSQVSRIERRDVLSLALPRTKLRIYVKDRKRSIDLPYNPESKELKKDLYSWLLQKISTQSANVVQ